MIEERKFETWPEFEKYMQKELREVQEDPTVMPYIYRGQSDASWELNTTLDRVIWGKMSMSSYYSMIFGLLPEIETFTGSTWDSPSKSEYFNWFEKMINSNALLGINIPAVEYMAYLRHHGFPSPILDWSKSPFIAAYFAFRDISSKAENVAIYKYQQSYTGDPLTVRPTIFEVYGIIRANRKHYLQQSVYTICCSAQDQNIYYGSHEDAFLRYKEDAGTGWWAVKYIIPASEREIALLSLDKYNINAYSLIGTEESLLETLFLRKYAYIKNVKNNYPGWEGTEW